MVKYLIEKMHPLKWSSIAFTEIAKNDFRFDATSYNLDSYHARDLVENGIYPCGKLKSLMKQAYYPLRFKRIYGKKEFGTPFYSSSQITEIFPKPQKYLLPATKCNIQELKLRPNTLLLTRSGTVGNVCIVSKTLTDCVFSDHVIRITFNNDYDLGYVYAFLKTKTGKQLLQATSYGSVVTQIEPEHIACVIIPLAPQNIREKINEKIRQSYSLRDSSNELIDNAEKLLIEELALLPIDAFFEIKEKINIFSLKYSELEDRLDVPYHIQGMKKLTKHIKDNCKELVTIGDKRITKDIIQPGRFTRTYVNDEYGKTFIGGKQITELDPTNKKYLSFAKHKNRIKSLELQENMTLITRSGTIGKVALVGKQWQNWIASEHIIRIVPASKNIAGYISVFLSTEYGKALVTRYIYGSVVNEIEKEHIQKVPIPLLKNENIQNKINNLALEAKEKRYQAYIMEQDAIKMMDEQILKCK